MLAIRTMVLEEAALAVVRLSGCVKAQVVFALIPMVTMLVSGDPSASCPRAVQPGLVLASAVLTVETAAMGVGITGIITVTATEEMELRAEPGVTVAVGVCPVGHRLPLIAQTVKVVVGEELASKIASQAVTVGFATSEGTGGNVSNGHCIQRFLPCSVSIDYSRYMHN